MRTAAGSLRRSTWCDSRAACSGPPNGVLSQESLEAMARVRLAAPARPGRRAAGQLLWAGLVSAPVGREGRYNLWHTGLFSGSSTMLVIRHDGLCWAVLFNTSATADGRAPAEKIDPRSSGGRRRRDVAGRDQFHEFLTSSRTGADRIERLGS